MVNRMAPCWIAKLISSDLFPFLSNDNSLYIGGNTSGNYFSGLLDDIRIYSTPLQEPFISFIYDETIKTGQWSLDEKDGAICHDISGNANHGALINDPVWMPQEGKFNGAVYFDGIDDYVKVRHSNTFSFNSELSFSIWIKPLSYPEANDRWDIFIN